MTTAGGLVHRAPRRDLASLPERLVPPMPAGGWRGWVGPLLVTALAAVIRIVNLGHPHAIVFDETYYPKDALSLLRFGVERGFLENANELLIGSDGNWRELDIWTDKPGYVVHPPLGKWLIGLGEYMFGATPFGWRISVAVLGVIAVLLTARIARRLTRSNLLGTIAGLLLAIDGMHIVLSRTGLLDLILGFWVLVAFGLLLLDRDRMRARLAQLVRESGGEVKPTRVGPAKAGSAGLEAAAQWRDVSDGWGPRLGLRPLRWAAAFALGAATATKWSGLWFVVAFGLMTVLWDVSARRIVGVRHPWKATLLRDALPTAAAWVGIVIVVYLVSWTGWFLSDDGYARDWAASQGPSIIPESLRSLWHYHAEAYRFHVGLRSEHSYASNPLSWLLQTRPTSFYWDLVEDGTGACGAQKCASSVLALGNPVIWWVGTLALVHQLWRWAARRDWRSGAVLAGVAAGWVPWLFTLDRTVFTFYTVVFAPFLVMALTLTLGAIIGPADASEKRRERGALVAGAVVVAAVVVAWWFMPVWTGESIPYEAWRLRMWMPTWI